MSLTLYANDLYILMIYSYESVLYYRKYTEIVLTDLLNFDLILVLIWYDY